MTRWILHLDMDAFFASVEQLDNPQLAGKPVIVGGLGPRGVVATASYEARTFGVHSAMPMAKARRLCPHGVFLAPRFERYQQLSARIHSLVSQYSPLVEPVSLDEVFVDLTGTERLHGPPEQVAREIHSRIPEEVGLPCSVGLAPNKLLAKLASNAAKPGGLRVIRPEEVAGFLTPLPVEALWGIGPKTARKLASRGIYTVGDLQGVEASLLVSWFGPKLGEHLWRLARGLDDSPVVPLREAKSLSQELTLPEDVYRLEEIQAHLRGLTRQVWGRLRQAGLLARVVRVKLRWSDFSTHTRQLKLPEPTDHLGLLLEAARQLLARLLATREGRGVRLLGVGLAGLTPASFRPLHLFAPEEIDQLVWGAQAKYGPGALQLGEQGPHPPESPLPKRLQPSTKGEENHTGPAPN